MKRRILVDLNVILDVLLDRAPHADAASAVWAAIEQGQVDGFLAAHAVTTLHDLVTRARGAAFGDRCVSDVLTIFAVAPVDRDVLSEAIALGWADFEDAVCATSATRAGCHLITTRDPRGFRGSPCPPLSPSETLALLHAAAPEPPPVAPFGGATPPSAPPDTPRSPGRRRR